MDPGDWADKMRDNDPIRDDDSLKDDFFYQRYLPDRSKFESDSDDSEMTTSNSSEIDMQYQVSLSKSVPNNAERSKLKKSISKTMKSPDIRYTCNLYVCCGILM